MTSLAVIGIFLVSLLLSAFFSGSETGLYRIPRLRLVIDSLSGKTWSRVLLGLTNNPSFFVATTLVGNNVANYLTGLSIVLLAQAWVGEFALVELISPILLSPIVFVYGELLPKNLFLQAPYRLMAMLAPAFVFFTILLSPLALVLWGLGRVVEWMVGTSPAKAQLSLARRELQQVLKESEEVGLLRPAQQALAQNLFTVASKHASEFGVPYQRLPAIRRGSSVREALRIARRNRLTALPVLGEKGRDPVGYVRTIDLNLQASTSIDEIRPLVEIHHQQLHSAVLIQLQSAKEPIAKLVDDQGVMTGYISVNDLVEPLLAGNLAALRR